MDNTFVEICLYEVKPEKADEFETLLIEVADHYKRLPGVKDVRYMKRTHRQKDFNAAKNGESPIRLTKIIKAVTYVLYWELEDEKAHGQATKYGIEHFYKRFNRCLITMPKIILGDKLI